MYRFWKNSTFPSIKGRSIWPWSAWSSPTLTSNFALYIFFAILSFSAGIFSTCLNQWSITFSMFTPTPTFTLLFYCYYLFESQPVCGVVNSGKNGYWYNDRLYFDFLMILIWIPENSVISRCYQAYFSINGKRARKNTKRK